MGIPLIYLIHRAVSKRYNEDLSRKAAEPIPEVIINQQA